MLMKVEVVGTSKQSPETVVYRSGLKTGDDLRNVDLTGVMERLWSSGAFDDIKLEVEDVEGGKKLIIRVVERACRQGGGIPGRHEHRPFHREGQGQGDEDDRAGPRLRSRGRAQGQGTHRGEVRGEGLPLPGRGRGSRARRPRCRASRLRHQRGREGEGLQGHVHGQQGPLERQAPERHEEDQEALVPHLDRVPRPAGGKEPGRRSGEHQEGLLAGRLQGCLHRQAGDRGRGLHDIEPEGEERRGHFPREEPQVRPSGPAHDPDPGGRALLRRAPSTSRATTRSSRGRRARTFSA